MMKISSIRKEAIYIVIEIINKRIEWIKENEPYATYEIEENEMILSLLHDLVDLEINN